MSEFKIITEDLLFPEGPIAMPDGSIILVEIARGTLTRVLSSGRKEIIATIGGGPNGAAIGPDGACYICNNGVLNGKKTLIQAVLDLLDKQMTMLQVVLKE